MQWVQIYCGVCLTSVYNLWNFSDIGRVSSGILIYYLILLNNAGLCLQDVAFELLT